MKKKVVHFISRDKFTEGYINWMTYMFSDMQHFFVTRESENKMDLCEGCNVFYYKNEKDIFTMAEIINISKDADCIIVSGLFYGILTELSFLIKVPKEIKKKIFLQFWGGDFYKFRNCKNLKRIIEKNIRRKTVMSVKAIIMLIEEDYEQIKSILNIEKENYVAIMPNDPRKNYIFKTEKELDNTLRILLGNSSTVENQHIEIMDILSKFKGEDIEIVCPLSYGDEKYREKVISKGQDIFGKKFIPILELMDKQSYINLLSTCDIGVFNNNRQQAMGNINLMFRLGKKIFIRSDNSMWNMYQKKGFIFYDTTKISEMSLEHFRKYEESDRTENLKAINRLNDDSKAVDEWKKVFNS